MQNRGCNAINVMAVWRDTGTHQNYLEPLSTVEPHQFQGIHCVNVPSHWSEPRRAHGAPASPSASPPGKSWGMASAPLTSNTHFTYANDNSTLNCINCFSTKVEVGTLALVTHLSSLYNLYNDQAKLPSKRRRRSKSSL